MDKHPSGRFPQIVAVVAVADATVDVQDRLATDRAITERCAEPGAHGFRSLGRKHVEPVQALIYRGPRVLSHER
jgi:hypothetical protein